MANQFNLYLERIDASINMHRFYALSIQPTLFGEVTVVRCWGRIGTRGRSALAVCPDEPAALTLLLSIARAKRRRNYRPRPAMPAMTGQARPGQARGELDVG